MMTEQLKQLPFAERLELAAELWDSVVDDPSHTIALSEEQIYEIDRRLDLLALEPKKGTSWEVFRDRMLATL